MLKSLQTV